MTSTTNGVIWSAIERFSVQGIQFLLSIVIARLITPEEYGLLAMLAIFMAVAQTFVDSGFGNALIQKKDRNSTDYSTVFYFSVATAIVLYGGLYLAAPLISDFYHQPQLTLITRWFGLNLILMSLSLVQRTKLSIELDFKTQTKISLVAVIVSGAVGIIMAYKGFGVWALVVQGLVNNLISSLLFWFASRWQPMLVFSTESFRRLFSFGSKLLMSGLLHTIYLNFYSLVIGRVYNAQDVGYYNRAYSISQYPSVNIVTVMCRAIYPVQCEHQNDDKWLEESFTRYLRMGCYIIFPMMTLLAIISRPLVSIVLTDKWLPAADLISILCLAYMWYPVMVFNNQILNVKGRSDLFLRAEIIKKVVAIAILFATLPFGLKWLCWGVLIYNLSDMGLIIHYVKMVMKTGYLRQFKSITGIFLMTCLCMLVSCFCMVLCKSLVIELLVSIVVFSLMYLLLSRSLKINEYFELTHILSRIKHD